MARRASTTRAAGLPMLFWWISVRQRRLDPLPLDGRSCRWTTARSSATADHMWARTTAERSWRSTYYRQGSRSCSQAGSWPLRRATARGRPQTRIAAVRTLYTFALQAQPLLAAHHPRVRALNSLMSRCARPWAAVCRCAMASSRARATCLRGELSARLNVGRRVHAPPATCAFSARIGRLTLAHVMPH